MLNAMMGNDLEPEFDGGYLTGIGKENWEKCFASLTSCTWMRWLGRLIF